MSYEAVDALSRRELWRRYVAGGRADEGLRNYLLSLEQKNLLRLAVKFGATLPASIDAADLAQAGALGLMDAARRYDPERFTFWTFASQRAARAMRDYVREQDVVPRLTRERAARRLRFAESFVAEHGREPSAEEVRLALGWNGDEYHDSHARGLESLEATLYEEDGGRLTGLRDVLAACEDAPDGALITESFFREVCRGLGMEEQVIVWLYFVRGATMKHLGLALGLSESRVSQLTSGILRRLRERLGRERASA